VDGYEQAFGDGTPVAVAKAQVLKLLPSDAHTTSFNIEHTATGSCALWNVQSKTLGAWFASPKTGDTAGVVGISLHGTNANNESSYSPSNVSTANVGLAPATKGTNC
jgi:hypothetical protein